MHGKKSFPFFHTFLLPIFYTKSINNLKFLNLLTPIEGDIHVYVGY